ncbi:hypothetical protein PLICRDRAFT_53116 [Plicaturopsis crispa FD-325 SS-3]|nr:hypothetical protein PLICRDRAFT_53116 [Plicaturopsis crispa FD-325 SS-3]
MDPAILNGLNPAQLEAVQHRPDVPLQILAGPGSGKTKVLTSRIAYLILHHGLAPSSICAVTFTNKAANEMRDRLTKIIGKQRTNALRMGTFHALCARFLRSYPQFAGLSENFTIYDADESKKSITRLLKPHKQPLAEKNVAMTESTVMSMISKAKAKAQTPDEMRAEAEERPKNLPRDVQWVPDPVKLTVARIYKEYDRALRMSNSLDFDDLLVFGVRLFSHHPPAVRWCKHVLVDEFQDTNLMQYDLMRYIASANRCVTIVGDPDQSIYGWRSAEVANLAKMRKDFPATVQVLLEQNYRSTASILASSLAIIAQDKNRIPKSLYTSHPAGPVPMLHCFKTEHVESSWMAVEIKRVIAQMGGVLGYGDFVVLLRFNALSRVIESALQREGIPSRILGGHKFFERMEVKDVLAYLQVVDNPHFIPAFSRAINVPARSIGVKTLKQLLDRAEETNTAPLTIAEKIYDSKIADIKPPVKRKLKPFIEAIRELRKLAEGGASPELLIRRVTTLIDYQDWLKKTQPDWQDRWENVQELITFATEVDGAAVGQVDLKTTPLRTFLQASMLSSEGDVSIATCHAAKGLEWPVVFVPAVEQGIYPISRAEDDEEERRLLYVACTRAQGLLYLTHAAERMRAGMTYNKELSDFSLFTKQFPQFTPEMRGLLSTVLHRPVPSEAEVRQRVEEL